MAPSGVRRGVSGMTQSALVASAGQDGDIDLRSLGAALARRKRWIVWPTLLVAIASAVTVNVLTPRYKSEARIVYDGRENVFLRPEADKTSNQDRTPADAETLTNQIQIVLSRPLALEVIGELKLNELPEFDPMLRASGPCVISRTWRGVRATCWRSRRKSAFSNPGTTDSPPIRWTSPASSSSSFNRPIRCW